MCEGDGLPLVRDDGSLREPNATAAEDAEQSTCPACTFINTGHPEKCVMCGTSLAIVGAAAEAQQLPPVLPTAPHAGGFGMLVTKVGKDLWLGQLPDGHLVEFGTGTNTVFDELWLFNAHAAHGPHPTTGGVPPAGTNLWVILGLDKQALDPLCTTTTAVLTSQTGGPTTTTAGARYYAELTLESHMTRREVECVLGNEAVLNGLHVGKGKFISGTDFPRDSVSSPPTPMPVKYSVSLSGGGLREVVFGPQSIYSIMNHVQDPNRRRPPSGAPTKLFIALGTYSEKQVKEYQKRHGEGWQPGPDVVSVLDPGGYDSTSEAAVSQSAFFEQSLQKIQVTKVDDFTWEFDASSVGAKEQEGLGDGANDIFDFLYKHHYGKEAQVGCSLQCSVSTSRPACFRNPACLYVECTFHRHWTKKEMQKSVYMEGNLPATEYTCVGLRPDNESDELPMAHFCPAVHKFFPDGLPKTLWVYVDGEAPTAAAVGAAGEAVDESIVAWNRELAKGPGHRTWNCETCTFCNTMRGSTYAWLRARRTAYPGCEPTFQCMACTCWQTFPQMLTVSFNNAGDDAMLTPVYGDLQQLELMFGPVLCRICKEMAVEARPNNYHEAHCHKILVSDLSTVDGMCAFAIGKYTEQLGHHAKPVKQVDIYYNPAVQAKFLAKAAEFQADRKDGSRVWIFHGTPDTMNVPKICTDGFKVGGQGGHPMQHAAVYGEVRLP